MVDAMARGELSPVAVVQLHHGVAQAWDGAGDIHPIFILFGRPLHGGEAARCTPKGWGTRFQRQRGSPITGRQGKRYKQILGAQGSRGLGYMVWGLRFRVFGFNVQSLGCRAYVLGFRDRKVAASRTARGEGHGRERLLRNGIGETSYGITREMRRL